MELSDLVGMVLVDGASLIGTSPRSLREVSASTVDEDVAERILEI